MQADLIEVDPAQLARWNRAVPRYTSYPTAPQFAPLEQGEAEAVLRRFDGSDKPLSVYVHIPFCKTMCLFCGCSVILNRKPERQAVYLEHLLREIDLTAGRFRQKRKLAQLHWGGGTPTSLTEEECETLFLALQRRFEWGREAEISIEVDPRTVYADNGKKLETLRRLGFNRVSFGVQDLDPAVQEAVRRRQTEKMTVETVEKARELGFEGINIDLIYGLPLQTVEKFAATAQKLIELRPDRIAMYSYAKVPWLKPHQKAIPEETLPSAEEKFRIYVEARRRFMEAGYTAIGMDHFALPSDPIAKGYREKKLTRNFQGYSLGLADDMLGFGVTAIGFIENGYLQNAKELDLYQARLDAGLLPIARGFVLSDEDLRRRWAIQSLMCHFALDKREFERKFGLPFDIHFREARQNLLPLIQEGLAEETPEQIVATPLGRLFIRLIAAAFDAYLDKGQFSRAV